MKKLYLFIIVGLVLITLFSVEIVYASNLIKNPSFEDGIQNWSPANGKIILSAVSEPSPHSGSKVLKIENSVNSTSAYGAEQEVENITPSGRYLISAFAMFDDTNVKEANIKIGWYKENATSQFATTELSQPLNTPTNSWHELTEVITAPNEAVKADIRLVVSKKIKEEKGVVYFDDVFFQPDYSMTSSLSSTVAPTQLPTGTGLKEHSSSPPITTSQPTQYSTGTVAGVSRLNKDQEKNIGNTATNNFDQSTESVPLSFNNFDESTQTQQPNREMKKTNLSFFIILSGLVLVGLGTGFYFLRKRRLGKNDI